jgi:probable rRNA maturation factor
MHIDFVYQTDIEIDTRTFDIIFTQMKSESVFSSDDSICVIFTTDAQIKELNHKYRGKNQATDVLTFTSEVKNIPFKGDIVINIEQADRQKPTESHSQRYSSREREIVYLFIHGLLHLAGMDHLNKKSQSQMYLFENKYRDFANTMSLNCHTTE